MNIKVHTLEPDSKLLRVVSEICFADYKTELLLFRQRVWEETDPILAKQLFINGYYDKFDDHAFHWGVFEDGRLIAAARLSKHYTINDLPDQHLLNGIAALQIDFPIASMNRLVVDKKFQDNGISALLDRARLEKACEIGCHSICVATYGLRGKKLLADGFEVFGLPTLKKDFETSKQNAKPLPPAFYYKRIGKYE